MHGTNAARPQDALIELSRDDWDIAVVANREHDSIAQCRVTRRDRETATPIGNAIAQASASERSSVLTAGDVLELIGDRYRLASIAVDIEVNDLRRRIRRVSARLRLRQRLWRRRTRGAQRRSPLDRVDIHRDGLGSLRRIQP